MIVASVKGFGSGGPYAQAAARALLSTVIGPQHSLVDMLVEDGRDLSPEPGEVVIADALIAASVKRSASKSVQVYRVISAETLAHIEYLMTP